MSPGGQSLPAWSTLGVATERALPVRWPEPVGRDWAWGGSTGRGVRVCVIDSGIARDHPRVGILDGAVARPGRRRGQRRVVEDSEPDRPATAPRARASSARSPRTARSTACACSARTAPAAGARCSPGWPGPSSRASTWSTSRSRRASGSSPSCSARSATAPTSSGR